MLYEILKYIATLYDKEVVEYHVMRAGNSETYTAFWEDGSYIKLAYPTTLGSIGVELKIADKGICDSGVINRESISNFLKEEKVCKCGVPGDPQVSWIKCEIHD